MLMESMAPNISSRLSESYPALMLILRFVPHKMSDMKSPESSQSGFLLLLRFEADFALLLLFEDFVLHFLDDLDSVLRDPLILDDDECE